MAEKVTVFESLIQYRSKGDKEALSVADQLDSTLDNVREPVDVKIDTKLTDDSAIKRVESLDSVKVTPVIDAQETSTGKDIADKLNLLAGLGVIDLVMNVSGGAVEFVNTFAKIGGVSGIFEMDTALSTIEARTGGMIPNAEKLITDLYVNGWGESRQAIADVVVEANNLGISQARLSTATGAALLLQKVYGLDTAETLRTLDSLVKTGLAKDFQEASDILVTGLQTGANRGDDLLDTFNEYATTFSGMGLSGGVALGIINIGLANGVDNSDRMADAMREVSTRLSTIGTDENIANAFKQLDALSDVDLKGLLNAYEAGQITGDEFYQGFFTALTDASTADPAAAQGIASALIGTQADDFKVAGFTGLEAAFDTTFLNIEGRATEAGAAINNNISAQLDGLWKSIEVAAQDFLSSEQIDLPGKIDNIKQQLTAAVDVLKSGGTLGEALEVGFKLQGVDAFLSNIQSAIGNFVINLLEMIASIQDFLGKGSGGTRTQIAGMAEGQLAFDLKLADDGQAITDAIQIAAARGVDVKTIAEQAGVAVEELLAEGKVGAAQAIVEEIQFQGQGFVLSPEIDPIFGEGVLLQNSLNTWIENRDLDMINQAISKGLVIAPEGIDVSDLQTEVDTAAKELMTQFDSAIASGDLSIASSIAKQLNDPALIEQVNTLAEAFGGVMTTDFDTMAQDLATAKDDMTASAGEMAAGVAPQFAAIGEAATAADTSVVNAVTGNSIVPQMRLLLAGAAQTLPLTGLFMAGLAESAQTNLSIVDTWVRLATNSMMGFGNVLPILDLLIAKLGQAAAAATATTNNVNSLPTSPPGGGNQTQGSPTAVMAGASAMNAVSSSQSTVNVYQYYNVQSSAQAASAAQQTANAVRGFSK